MTDAPFFRLFRTALSFVNWVSSCGASADAELAGWLLFANFVSASRVSDTYCGRFVVLIRPIRQIPCFYSIAVYCNLHEGLIGYRLEKLCEKCWRECRLLDLR